MAFFFNDTATTEIYTLSLHDALPIYQWSDVVTYDNDEERGLDPVSLDGAVAAALTRPAPRPDRKSTRLNSSHANISHAVFCLKIYNLSPMLIISLRLHLLLL